MRELKDEKKVKGMTQTCLFTLQLNLLPPGKCSGSLKFSSSTGTLLPSLSFFLRWHLAPGSSFTALVAMRDRMTSTHGVLLGWVLPQGASLVSGPYLLRGNQPSLSFVVNGTPNYWLWLHWVSSSSGSLLLAAFPSRRQASAASAVHAAIQHSLTQAHGNPWLSACPAQAMGPTLETALPIRAPQSSLGHGACAYTGLSGEGYSVPHPSQSSPPCSQAPIPAFEGPTLPNIRHTHTPLTSHSKKESQDTHSWPHCVLSLSSLPHTSWPKGSGFLLSTPHVSPFGSHSSVLTMGDSASLHWRRNSHLSQMKCGCRKSEAQRQPQTGTLRFTVLKMSSLHQT